MDNLRGGYRDSREVQKISSLETPSHLPFESLYPAADKVRMLQECGKALALIFVRHHHSLHKN